MAAASGAMCISARGVSIAALACRGVIVSRRTLPVALRRNCSGARCALKNSSSSRGSEDGWIAENDALVRSVPLVLGGGALVTVLLNRTFSGIAPVADSSSAQSRSDVLALALAATVLLQGLVWKSIQPRPVVSVEMDGVDCFNMERSLTDDAAQELTWVWDALRSATRTKAMVVIYGGACVFQAGVAATTMDGSAAFVNASEFTGGALYKGVQKSGRQNYLANLVLYPGRFELSFLPSNTQAVLLQPLGDDGVLVLASDTIRGFTPADQAWLGTIAEKVDTTLQDWVASSAATVEGQAPL